MRACSRAAILGAIFVFVLCCGKDVGTSSPWHMYDDKLAAYIKDNNVGGIISFCQSDRCTDRDVFEALGWASSHETSGGLAVAQAIVTNTNLSLYAINHGLSQIVEAGKVEIGKVLLASSRIGDATLHRALQWAITNEGRDSDNVGLIQAIVWNSGTSHATINLGLCHAVSANRYESIKFLASATKADTGCLLAALQWAADQAEGARGGTVARIVLNNPVVEAGTISKGFDIAIKKNSGSVVIQLANSYKATDDDLHRALMWAVCHGGSADAMQTVRVIIRKPNMSHRSIDSGIYFASRMANRDAIKILVKSAWASSYALGDALSYISLHEEGDYGDVAQAIVENEHAPPRAVERALYNAIQNGKRETIKVLVNSGRLDDGVLGNVLAHIGSQEERDTGYVAKVIIENPSVQQVSIQRGLYVAIEHNKSEIIAVLASSGRLERAELRNAFEWAELMGFSEIAFICIAKLESLWTVELTHFV